MSSKDKVEFLLEIMKAKTTTRQQSQDDAAPIPAYPFCDCGNNTVSDHDTEVREQPPKTSPPANMMTCNPSMSSTSNEHRGVCAFDYYGNPIKGKQPSQPQNQFLQSVHYFNSPARQFSREDYSEFLELNPTPTPKFQNSSAKVEPGCIAEFGQCMKVSFCCAADENLIHDTIVEVSNTEMGTMKAINDELQPLRHATQDAKTSKAMLEFELRSELNDIRRQTAEMEESYRQEIERQVSQKVLLQAQLQQKLLSIMEDRMLIDVQLGQLNSISKQATGSHPSQEKDSIPTATCTTAMDSALVPVEKLSQLSVAGGTSTSTKKSVDPPASQTSSMPIISAIMPKSGMIAKPFGLSAVVEIAANGARCEPEGAFGEELASPTNNRSPPSSPLPNNTSFTGSQNRSPSYNLLPLPVATPLGQVRAASRGFQTSE